MTDSLDQIAAETSAHPVRDERADFEEWKVTRPYLQEGEWAAWQAARATPPATAQAASDADALLDWLDAQWEDGLHIELSVANPGLTWHGLHRRAVVFTGRGDGRFEKGSVREAIRAAIAQARGQS